MFGDAHISLQQESAMLLHKPILHLLCRVDCILTPLPTCRHRSAGAAAVQQPGGPAPGGAAAAHRPAQPAAAVRSLLYACCSTRLNMILPKAFIQQCALCAMTSLWALSAWK